jgi:hypothetical protein
LPSSGADFEGQNPEGEGLSQDQKQEEWCHKEEVRCLMDDSHLSG